MCIAKQDRTCHIVGVVHEDGVVHDLPWVVHGVVTHPESPMGKGFQHSMGVVHGHRRMNHPESPYWRDGSGVHPYIRDNEPPYGGVHIPIKFWVFMIFNCLEIIRGFLERD